MNLKHLRTFAAVVQHGSVLRAAHALDQPRALLRRHVDALEAEVGITLLHRDAEGIKLTAAGEALVGHAKSLLRQGDEALADARLAATGGSGVVHILEPIGLPSVMRLQGLLAMAELMPKVRFTMRQLEDPAAHLTGPCDVVLHLGPPLDRSAWNTRIVARVPLRLMASPEYLALRGTPTTVHELATHTLLMWSRPHEPDDSLPLCDGRRITAEPWLVSPDLPLLRALAAAGAGIVFSPYVPMLEEPGVGPLIRVLEDQVGGEAVYRASSRLPARADLRIRAAMEQIRAMLDEVIPP